MTDARILPDLQCSLLCEDIRQEANGNPILIGILSQLVVPQLPVTAFKIICFNRWAAGVGKFTEYTKIIMPDQSTVLCENKIKFDLDRPENSRTNVHVFGNVEFKEPGVYQIEVTVDDVLKLRYPFPVLLVAPKDVPSPGESGD